MNTYPAFIIFFISLVIFSCHSNSGKREIKQDEQRIIGIQPYGGFDVALADSAAAQLEIAYGMKTVVLPSIPLPESAYVNIRKPRYRADSLIKHLALIKPDSLYILVGLTDEDISITKYDSLGHIKKPASKYIDFGIFGLGFCPGTSCVVSVNRYQQGNRAIFFDRFFKICKHEVGHNLGLSHCPDKTCIMQDAAESITTIDRAGPFLCKGCKTKIK